MNDEIKGIIEDLSLFDETDNMPYEVKGEDCKLLLDYITDLQKENERLKEKVNDNKIVVEYAIKPSFTTRKLKEYKSRIDKAIEYISNTLCDNKAMVRKDISGKEIDNLIYILEGSDKE